MGDTMHGRANAIDARRSRSTYLFDNVLIGLARSGAYERSIVEDRSGKAPCGIYAAGGPQLAIMPGNIRHSGVSGQGIFSHVAVFILGMPDPRRVRLP